MKPLARNLVRSVSMLAVPGATMIAEASAASATEPAASCATVSTSGPEVEEIRELEHRGARSNVEGWSIEEARAFFAPEWVSVSADGTHSGVDVVLSEFVNGRSRPWAGRFEISDLDIRVYCDVAVVVGRAAAYAIGAPAAADRPGVRFRWLNVWRRQDGRWLYAANQFTRY